METLLTLLRWSFGGVHGIETLYANKKRKPLFLKSPKRKKNMVIAGNAKNLNCLWNPPSKMATGALEAQDAKKTAESAEPREKRAVRIHHSPAPPGNFFRNKKFCDKVENELTKSKGQKTVIYSSPRLGEFFSARRSHGFARHSRTISRTVTSRWGRRQSKPPVPERANLSSRCGDIRFLHSFCENVRDCSSFT